MLLNFRTSPKYSIATSKETVRRELYIDMIVDGRGHQLCNRCTVGHKSHDLCFHVFLMEARVMTFVANCTKCVFAIACNCLRSFRIKILILQCRYSRRIRGCPFAVGRCRVETNLMSMVLKRLHRNVHSPFISSSRNNTGKRFCYTNKIIC